MTSREGGISVMSRLHGLLLLLGVGATCLTSASPLEEATRPAGYDNTCKTCLVLSRILSDYLCDFEFVAWSVDQVEQLVCPAVPEHVDDCHQVG
jgi:hypothetical protein